jgi:hypothetical protein
MTGIEPALSAWEDGEPTTHGRFCVQTSPFKARIRDLCEGVGARGGPEQLIKVATGHLRRRLRI